MSIGAGASCVHPSRERAICHTFSGAVTAPHSGIDSPSAFPAPLWLRPVPLSICCLKASGR